MLLPLTVPVWAASEVARLNVTWLPLTIPLVITPPVKVSLTVWPPPLHEIDQSPLIVPEKVALVCVRVA